LRRPSGLYRRGRVKPIKEVSMNANPEAAPGVTRGVIAGIAAMTIVVAASNVLVQFPINDWLTWGALSYPLAFLVNDLINRSFGPVAARRVVYAGFATGVIASLLLSDVRIAVASGTAFLVAQLLDVFLFDRLRRSAWWRAPLISSTLGSVLDTALFFSLAFAGTGLPWVTWGLGDLATKLVLALVFLAPFRMAMAVLRPLPARAANGA
jgi:hypothetical protein